MANAITLPGIVEEISNQLLVAADDGDSARNWILAVGPLAVSLIVVWLGARFAALNSKAQWGKQAEFARLQWLVEQRRNVYARVLGSLWEYMAAVHWYIRSSVQPELRRERQAAMDRVLTFGGGVIEHLPEALLITEDPALIRLMTDLGELANEIESAMASDPTAMGRRSEILEARLNLLYLEFVEVARRDLKQGGDEFNGELARAREHVVLLTASEEADGRE
jgi:hypothetical protein